MRNCHVSAVQHQAGNLIDGQVFCQICSSFGCRQSPVFICVKRVVLIVVLEEKTISFKQLYSGSGTISQVCSLLLLYQNEVINFSN